MITHWVYEIDGDTEAGFLSRYDAVEAAVTELDLDECQQNQLIRDGWLPIGQLGSVSVYDSNENHY